MKLDDIEIFVKVVNCKSFSNAAKLLRLPKSTLSRRIAQLEEHLGVKLLNRTTRQLSPTPIGQAYYEKCLAILDRFEDANDLIKGLQATPKGRLRLTVPYELGVFFLKDIITSFLKIYPEITLELEFTNRIIDIVEEGFDVAVRIGKLEDSSLIAVKLGTLQGGIYASPSFLENKLLPQSPLDLPLSECIQFRTTHVLNWVFQRKDQENIEIKPNGRVQANSMIYICESAMGGLGFAAITDVVARPYVQQGKLMKVLENYKLTFADLFAVYPSGKFISLNVRAFIDFIKPPLSKILKPEA